MYKFTIGQRVVITGASYSIDDKAIVPVGVVIKPASKNSPRHTCAMFDGTSIVACKGFDDEGLEREFVCRPLTEAEAKTLNTALQP